MTNFIEIIEVVICVIGFNFGLETIRKTINSLTFELLEENESLKIDIESLKKELAELRPEPKGGDGE
ncbi:MAG: hypothetical protein J6A37_14905 [Oscillospiraceae bacterium]|nr:hypothetical protein [Oscillospiraceae bacterium]